MSAKLILIKFNSHQSQGSVANIEKVMERFLFVKRVTNSQWLFLNLSDVCSEDLYKQLSDEVHEHFDIIELNKNNIDKNIDVINYQMPDPYRSYLQSAS